MGEVPFASGMGPPILSKDGRVGQEEQDVRNAKRTGDYQVYGASVLGLIR
jgi:hypothetical protein